jgi:hypothetical protein
MWVPTSVAVVFREWCCGLGHTLPEGLLGGCHVDGEEFNMLCAAPSLQVFRQRPDNKLLDQITL